MAKRKKGAKAKSKAAKAKVSAKKSSKKVINLKARNGSAKSSGNILMATMRLSRASRAL